MNRKKSMCVAAALLCLALAGCKTAMYPGDPAGDPDPEHMTDPGPAQIWQLGFNNAMAGSRESPYDGRPDYNSGYDAGAKYKANPVGPKPSNPYVPAGNQPPSATGGG